MISSTQLRSRCDPPLELRNNLFLTYFLINLNKITQSRRDAKLYKSLFAPLRLCVRQAVYIINFTSYRHQPLQTRHRQHRHHR